MEGKGKGKRRKGKRGPGSLREASSVAVPDLRPGSLPDLRPGKKFAVPDEWMLPVLPFLVAALVDKLLELFVCDLGSEFGGCPGSLPVGSAATTGTAALILSPAFRIAEDSKVFGGVGPGRDLESVGYDFWIGCDRGAGEGCFWVCFGTDRGPAWRERGARISPRSEFGGCPGSLPGSLPDDET
jgi:hypothetical protein